MKRGSFILFIVLLALSIASAAPLFGPSKSEVAMQQQIEQNRNTITFLKQHINELNERVDGLTTLIEGLNSTISQLQVLQQSQQPTPVCTPSDLALLEAKISKLEGECVRKKEYGQYQSGRGNSVASSTNKQSLKANSSSFEGKSRSDIYSEGVRLFQKQKYSEAKKRFSLTESKKYKPAASNYYLGEIAYYTKNYNDAIFYFKKSVSIYDQASYMDTLLLHTAISLEKSGDKSQAKTFYQTIIDGYPGKKSAKIAKKKLQKL